MAIPTNTTQRWPGLGTILKPMENWHYFGSIFHAGTYLTLSILGYVISNTFTLKLSL